MIIFHEGMPRSGKSYEALVQHIIPALSSGRKVYARVNGLNHEKLSTLTGKTEEELKTLLFEISEEDVFSIHDKVTNDSLVVIDELQNFFPSGRIKLSPEITKFVTEHGHRGLDIVTMGQSIADVHNLWRRRTQRKIQFIKQDMVGRPNHYKWTAFQGSLNGRGEVTFTKIKSGSKPYEEKYFGSYLSHEVDTNNKDNLEDNRLNIFKSSVFTFYLPVFLVVFIFALYWIYGFFTDPTKFTNTEEIEISEKVTPVLPAPASLPANSNLSLPSEPHVPQIIEHGFDFIETNNSTYQSKLTYLDVRRGAVWDLIVVWYDKSDKVMDRLYYSDFRSLGYSLKNEKHGVIIEKDGYRALYRFRPDSETNLRSSRELRDNLSSDTQI